MKAAQKVKLFNERNAQLGKLLKHIVIIVHYTEADDIDQSRIFPYLRQHYYIEAKGSNLIKITEERSGPAEDS